MARTQTRRTVSVSIEAHDRLRAHCQQTGQSMSEWVEREVIDPIGPRVEVPVGRPGRPPRASAPPAAEPMPEQLAERHRELQRHGRLTSAPSAPTLEAPATYTLSPRGGGRGP
jgi:hypothetical protein